MAIFTAGRPLRNSSRLSTSRFRLEAFHTRLLCTSETPPSARFLRYPGWREQIGITQLVLGLAEVLHLDQALFNQGLEAEIDRAKPHTQILGQSAQTDKGRLV